MIRLLTLLIAVMVIASPADAKKRIALTFDDIPRTQGAFLTPDERTVKLIAGLSRAGVKQAAFFLNPGSLDTPHGKGGEDRISAYVAAGHVIANHSFSHPRLSQVPAADYLADIDRAEAWLSGRDGRRPWFRFPYLDEGQKNHQKRDAIRAGLKARGLENGYGTADGADWNMEALTVAAVHARKQIDMVALRDLYVETMVEASNYYDDLARRAVGCSPAHTLVLHETDLAALFIADLVAALRKDGWEIVTADEAFADPIARMSPDVPSNQGPLIEMLAWQKGVAAPRWYDRADPAVANPLFAERVLHEKPVQ